MGPTVETSYGKVEGVDEGGVSVFRGIPFARPPAGELRFAAPRPPQPWAGVRQATRFGPAAPQPTGEFGELPGFGVDEAGDDCLNLNVWAPGLDGGRRPVMVWIPGGAFCFGSGSQAIYDGAGLAQRGDVVVVTLNYRLGALGFLHLRDLVGDEIECSSNAGLLDQVAALTWVRDNIEAFGGDPANVTIFGESAGGMSVGNLLGLPAAHGLFQRAIAQSGAAGDELEPPEATAVARTLLGHLDLQPGDARKLLELPLDVLLQAQQRMWTDHQQARKGLAFRPVVDGDVLPRSPGQAIADGLSADVALLAGTNVDEWRLFGMRDPESFSLDDDALLGRIAEMTSSDVAAASALIQAYRAGRPEASPSDLWFAIQSDRIFRVPAIRMAEAQSAHQPQTFAYLFTWPSPIPGLGACHGLEIPFVFATLDKPGMSVFAGATAEAAELCRRVQDAWVTFVHTSHPGHSGLPTWPAYDTRRRATMLLGERCEVEDAPFDAERQAWERA